MFGRIAVFAALCVGASLYATVGSQGVGVEADRDLALRQFEDDDRVAQEVRRSHTDRALRNVGLTAGIALVGVALFAGDLRRALAGRNKKAAAGLLAGAVALVGVGGCAKPFEPIRLEEIGNNEYAFLIPYTGDTTKQASVSNEDYLKRNMVLAKQIRIPQQWVPLGYETTGWNGEWKPAAKLLKVDGSPVTREWTADANSGTSTRNEAIWTMTADQIEWSTGWTCTARIANKDDAVKFLANYPNGSITQVLDTEVRAKLQATFGLAVTDLPMQELQKNSTPIIKKTVQDVETFFAERGITITNLGISGGYVYKDPKITQLMTEVFNAERQKDIKRAGSVAQEEENKRLQLAADAKARAIQTETKAEAEGIKTVADAKSYEITRAKEDLKSYMELKRIELEKAKIERWDGRYPTYYLGGAGQAPEMLLNVPGPPPEPK